MQVWTAISRYGVTRTIIRDKKHNGKPFINIPEMKSDNSLLDHRSEESIL